MRRYCTQSSSETAAYFSPANSSEKGGESRTHLSPGYDQEAGNLDGAEGHKLNSLGDDCRDIGLDADALQFHLSRALQFDRSDDRGLNFPSFEMPERGHRIGLAAERLNRVPRELRNLLLILSLECPLLNVSSQCATGN